LKIKKLNKYCPENGNDNLRPASSFVAGDDRRKEEKERRKRKKETNSMHFPRETKIPMYQG
jgi:hypothetical protein